MVGAVVVVAVVEVVPVDSAFTSGDDGEEDGEPGIDHDDVLLLAVADGHGSTRSFRSDRGSAMAADAI